MLRKHSWIQIKISKDVESMTIQNKLDSRFDYLKEDIMRIFLVNGVTFLQYRGFSSTTKAKNKFSLLVSPKFYLKNRKEIKENRVRLSRFLNACDIKEENKLIKVQISRGRLTTIFAPLNTIELSDEMMAKHHIEENENVNLIDLKNGLVKICTVRCDEALDDYSIRLNPRNREIFSPSPEVYVQKKSNLKFTRTAIQRVDQVLEGLVDISEDHREWVESCCGGRLEIVNEITGASMDISADQITYSALGADAIKLNYFQRLVLESNLPPKISDYYYKKFEEKLKDDPENLLVLETYYAKGKALTSEILKASGDDFNLKLKIKRALAKSGYPAIGLYPISREPKPRASLKDRMIEWLLEITIGSNPLNLKCIRPYETDENSNVVRLTQSTLELLGVDETDNLIITYRNKKVKARALVVNEVESIKETNIFQSESELNVCIGIPAHIRNKLGIHRIDVCCDVERDKRYLFEKNLNIQLLSIVATILTIKQTFNDNNKLVIILIILLVPVSIYVTFSAVRNRISND